MMAALTSGSVGEHPDVVAAGGASRSMPGSLGGCSEPWMLRASVRSSMSMSTQPHEQRSPMTLYTPNQSSLLVESRWRSNMSGVTRSRTAPPTHVP